MSVSEEEIMALLEAESAPDEMSMEIDVQEAGAEPMSEDEILTIIGTEMEQASTGTYTTELDANREDALQYYLGNPRGDEEDGRSQIVSTDVADAIEWILPQVIKALVAKGPVVTFDATSEQDETQAELETEFTHDVFMKENEGFLNLYEFTKDALMQKNGIFKIYYDESDKVTTERYDGLNQQEMQMLLAQPNVELVEQEQVVDEEAKRQAQQMIQMQAQQAMQQAQMQAQQPPQPQGSQQGPQGQPPAQQGPNPEQIQMQIQQAQQAMQQLEQNPPMRISCMVQVTTAQGKVEVGCVPPEEFRVNQYHDSLNLDDARFTSHVRLRTKSELIEDGYDPEIINNAGDNLSDTYDRESRFAEQGEDTSMDYNYSEDDSQTLLEVSECYMQIDVEGTGVSQLMLITVLGSSDPTDILEMTPIESNPFVSSSCIIMSHKFYGLSIYDRLKQLQDQKTSLWRNILDNLYLQNNREKEVVEGQVNIDDLLVSRPGGIKRVKAPNMIRELQVQPIGQEGYQMLDYLDQVRTGRVGVSPDTAGQIDALGTAVGSEGVARLQTAKEELTGLMVRVIAETGVKAAYLKIRDLLVRYKDSTTAFKFKGEWAKVNPAQWGERSRTTVQVGTGTGDDDRKVGAIQQVIAYQAQMVADPRNRLVDQEQLYSALDEFCRVSGLTGASEYFLDPEGKEGQAKKEQTEKQSAEEKQKQEQLEQMMAKAQADLGQAEIMKGQAAMQSQQAKIQVEQGKLQMDAMKQQSDNEKAAMQLELDTAKAEMDTITKGQSQQFDYAKLEQEEALTLTELELKYGVEGKKLELEKQKANDAKEVNEDSNNGME